MPTYRECCSTPGPTPNVTDHWGHTALHAVSRGRREQRAAIAKSLLSAGADVNAANCNGTTALMTAAIAGNVEIVQLLLSAGADCSKKSLYGLTALQAASETIRSGPAADYEAVVKALGAASCQ
jgi:ankyrin repeat protein